MPSAYMVNAPYQCRIYEYAARMGRGCFVSLFASVAVGKSAAGLLAAGISIHNADTLWILIYR